MYSSLCLRSMKRRVCSCRDRPLAASLIGYGPRLHLFQWISPRGSARQRHVTACDWEVIGGGSGLGDSNDHPTFHGYYFSSNTTNGVSKAARRGDVDRRQKASRTTTEPKSPDSQTCRWVQEDAALSNEIIIFLRPQTE